MAFDSCTLETLGEPARGCERKTDKGAGLYAAAKVEIGAG